MAVFIYADESGVLDREHNDFFTFGGVIFLDKESKDRASREYLSAERSLGAKAHRTAQGEAKASTLSPKHKSSLFRSLNGSYKFAVIIDQRKVLSDIFKDKKSKQRYLDYAFKIGLKHAFLELIKAGAISQNYSGEIFIFPDEHTTATDGRYELKEALENEFKRGTFNSNWNRYYPPIFPELRGLAVSYKNSESTTLVRAADIVANRAFYIARRGTEEERQRFEQRCYVKYLP